MRRLALNFARHEPTKDAMRGKLKRAAWNDDYPLNLIRAAARQPQNDSIELGKQMHLGNRY